MKKILIVIASLFTVFALSACTSQPPQIKTVKIGVIAPLS
jgi:starvation-inducible outer membrane lipoprotein